MIQFGPRSSTAVDDVDALEELGEKIANLAAHIHAATHRLLVLIAQFDDRRGWEPGGYRSCARWLHARTGIDLGAAREKVRAARVLTNLPKTGAAMARGELSFSKVRALTRVATPENEGELLDLARGCTTAELERLVRGWKRGSRGDEAALERERHQSRTFSVFPDDDGMYVVRGRLDPEVGALLMRAVEAASDALYRERRPAGAGAREPGADPMESRREAARRRADAVGLLAERALAAGLGSRSGRSTPVSGTRAERYQVVLHVEAPTLGEEGEPGRSELEDGTRVSAETSRRLSCDAGVVRVTHAAADSHAARRAREAHAREAHAREAHAHCPSTPSILDVGRRTRTVPPALRRALETRDRGCRFPGCGLRFTDGHHVRHWADGGETSLANCVLLCRHHHRLVHEGGWRIEWWGEGRPVFFDPRGGTHFDGRWKPPELGERPLDALIAGNRRQGVEPDGDGRTGSDGWADPDGWREPDGWTASARWEREADIPDDVYFRAMEAIG